jgi:hypothetical protein
MPMDYEGLLQFALREFERKVGSIVEREFAYARELRARHGEVCEVPIIGGEWRQCRSEDELQRLARQALRAQEWFLMEAPRWAQCLPLSLEACRSWDIAPNRRFRPVGAYARLLRGRDWDFSNAPPFEQFCADYHEQADG